METWLVQSVAGLLYGDGTCRQSDFSAAEDNGSYNTAAVDYGVPSADSYKFNASNWVLPGAKIKPRCGIDPSARLWAWLLLLCGTAIDCSALALAARWDRHGKVLATKDRLCLSRP